MSKPIIAVDCDDVIIGTAQKTLEYYNATYGTSIALYDFYSNDDAVWGADEATAIARVNAYLETPEFINQEPFGDAIEVVADLATRYELRIVTGRHDRLARVTSDMLHRHFPNIFGSIEFTNYFSDTPRSKSEVCRQIGAEYLVDDHLHHATVVAEAGMKVLLFGDYPWNRADSLHPNIQRVADWHAVRDVLMG